MIKTIHKKNKFLLPLAAVVSIGIIGSLLYALSHADSNPGTKGSANTANVAISSQAVKRCVGAPVNNDAALAIYDCHDDLGQNFNYNSAGEIRIKNVDNKCLGISNDVSSIGATVQLFTCRSDYTVQKWTYYPSTGELKGQSDRCLTVGNTSNSTSTNLLLNNCTGAANQKWTIGANPTTSAGTTTKTNTNLVSQQTSRCVGALSGNDASLALYPCANGPSQSFDFNAAGEIRIKTASDKCVGISNDVNSIGATVQLFTCRSDYTVQKWHYVATTGELKGQSDRCLSVGNMGANNGIGLLLNNCTGAANQKWAFGATVASAPSPTTAPTTTPAPTTPAPTTTPKPTTAPTTGPAPAPSGYVVKLIDKGGNCNGSTDNYNAFSSGLADLRSHGGGTLLLPSGHCKIYFGASNQTTNVNSAGHGDLQISRNITMQGASESSTVIDAQFQVAGYNYPFKIFDLSGDQRGAYNVTLRDFTFQRVSNNHSGIMIDFPNAASGVKIINVKLDGQGYNYDYSETALSHGQNDLEAFKVEQPAYVTDVSMSNITVTGFCYGFLTDSNFIGGMNNWRVDGSTFTKNYCDDLEFNAPETTGEKNISVTNSHFSNNLYNGPSQGAGIGVGFAHIFNDANAPSTIANNDFDGYNLDAIHLEDLTQNMNVYGNSTKNSFRTGYAYASHILIVSGTHNVTVHDNTCDTAGNSNKVSCILLSPGGVCAHCLVPSNVSIYNNTFRLRNGVATAITGSATVGNNTTISIP